MRLLLFHMHSWSHQMLAAMTEDRMDSETDLEVSSASSQYLLGGGKDGVEMAQSIARWMDEKAKEKGMEKGERGGFRLIP